MTRVLIFGGKTGWIGGLMYDLIENTGEFLYRTLVTNRIEHWRARFQATDSDFCRYDSQPRSG